MTNGNAWRNLRRLLANVCRHESGDRQLWGVYNIFCIRRKYYTLPELRKIMYTTNSIENLNRQFRKVTKSKAVFPSNKALMKSLFLAQDNLSSKWTGKVGGWIAIRAELIVYFGDRFTKYL